MGLGEKKFFEEDSIWDGFWNKIEEWNVWKLYEEGYLVVLEKEIRI